MRKGSLVNALAKISGDNSSWPRGEIGRKKENNLLSPGNKKNLI